jgi:hypothetical protein
LQDKLGCNYFAANTYLDEDNGEQKSTSVGLIKEMYLFKLHSTAPEEIFIEGDWYVPVGKVVWDLQRWSTQQILRQNE